MKRRTFLGSVMAFLGLSAVEAKTEEKPDILTNWPGWLKANDEGTMDVFRDLVIVNHDGNAHPVPIMWASDELTVKMVCALRSDPATVATVKLPMMNLQRGDFVNAPVTKTDHGIRINYHLTVRTLYREDMNQIIEQIINKFSPNPMLKNYELKSIANNMAEDDNIKSFGIDSLRVNKYVFNMQLNPDIRKGKK
jgi:hypothetical protein